MTNGMKLRQQRRIRDISQCMLAREMQIHITTLIDIERERIDITDETLNKAIHLLDQMRQIDETKEA